MLIPKFASDDKVFAKLRGYPPWPARVEGVADETPNKIKYHVFFYGTGETAVCKQEELCLYVDNKEKYGKPMKKKGFNTALAQIDAELGLGPPIQSPSGVQDNGINSSSSANESHDTNTSIASKNKNTNQRKRKKKENDGEILPKKPRKSILKDENGSEIQTPSTSNHQTTSRSGRKITKAKIYSENEEELTTETAACAKPKTTVRQKKVNVDAEIKNIKTKGVETTTPEGQRLTLELTLKKPQRFKTKKELDQWKSKLLLQVGELKSNIQSGDLSVEQIIEKIDNPFNKTIAELQQKNNSTENYEKLNYLKIEVKLLDLNSNIRQAANVEKADPDACLRHLDELNSIDIHPLMVKKNPEVVDTLKRLTKYVGKTTDCSEDEAEIFNSKAESIREKAKELCSKIKSLLDIPSGQSFSKCFFKLLCQFHQSVKDMNIDELSLLSCDPTEHLNVEECDINLKASVATSESDINTTNDS